MKPRYRSANALFLILVFLCVSWVATADAAQSSGRLIVLRSANFGWNIALNLKVDGRTISNVVQGRRFNQPIAAGRHVLTASAVPNAYYSEPTSTVLNVRPGQTYVFTATWDGSNRVVLVPSSLPAGQPY